MSKAYGERFAVVPDSIINAEVSVTAKALWAVLARYADPQGHCYPNVPTLAGVLRVSEQTVRRAKAELVGAGLMEVKPRFGEDGGQRSDDLFLSRGGSKNVTGPPSKNGRAGSSTSIELENTLREALKNEGQPLFDAASDPALSPSSPEEWQRRKECLAEMRDARKREAG